MDIENAIDEAFWNANGTGGGHYTLFDPTTEEEIGIIELKGSYEVYIEPFHKDEDLQRNIEEMTYKEFRDWVISQLGRQ